ncbi:MAG: hypothetical protein NUV81_01895, partial [bacterium]|nr:hypothetical protein [bacterium]
SSQSLLGRDDGVWMTLWTFCLGAPRHTPYASRSTLYAPFLDRIWYTLCMKRQTINRGIFVLIFALLFIGAYLFFVSGKENEKFSATPKPPISKETIPVDQSSAFIRVGTIAYSAKAGSVWNVQLATNTWADCLGDVYDPDGEVVLFETTDSAKAKLISPGSFKWSWNVPRDAQKGQWTIRLLCGNFENLATSEISVQVE